MEKRVLGITGGVGSGKSTVLALLKENYGAEIIEADRVARELMEPGGTCYLAVVEAFGTEICLADGEIDRKKLGEIVFRDEEKRLLLNSLTHLLVKEEVRQRIQKSESGLVVYESAIPAEACMKELCDEIWYVRVPEETRITRLMSSRGYTREKCLEIMAAQLSEEEFLSLADLVIENGGTIEETAQQVEAALLQGVSEHRKRSCNT